MSTDYGLSGDQSTRNTRVHVGAMAAIMQEFMQQDRSLLRNTTELRERARAAGLNEHEYAAISVLCSKLDAEGPAFLDRLRTSGW